MSLESLCAVSYSLPAHQHNDSLADQILRLSGCAAPFPIMGWKSQRCPDDRYANMYWLHHYPMRAVSSLRSISILSTKVVQPSRNR